MKYTSIAKLNKRAVKSLLLSGLALSSLSVFTMTFAPKAQAESTLITNIQGYSVNDGKLTTFSAIEFDKDKVVALYQEKPTAKTQAHSKVIDGKGQTLLPGLIDAHGHVLGYGLSLLRTQLRGSQSEADAVSRVVDFRKQNPDLTWIQGRGWNQVLWPTKTFPTAKSLDKYFPDTPVWLRRIDGHAGWANSAAMKLAGIDKNTQAPDGGEIIRDANGEPTGVLIDNAMDLISQKIPPLTKAEQKSVLLTSMQALAKEGLTSVHDAGVASDTLAVYKALAQEGKMPIRVYAMVAAGTKGFEQILAKGPYHDSSGKLDIASVKISSDGALGSRGAALIHDYSDKKGHKGLLLYSNQELARLIEQVMSAGFQVNTHAIGDNANKLVLDNYQKFIAKTGTQSLRHRIEHAQVLQLEDIPRFAELNVIASMQATHATSDKNMAEDRLGSERIKGAYAWRKLLDSGAIIAAGSDFPIESANPFFGLHASVTRQDHQNLPEQGWYADQAMTMTEALKSFTTDAAYSAAQEQQIGQLKPGMKADFILIDKNIFNVAPSSVWQTKVNQTWIDGQRVY